MERILKQILLFDKNFDFYRQENRKLIYKYENYKAGELTILELFLTDDTKIYKINLDTFIEGIFREGIYVNKDIDGKMIIDYYPQYKEYVSIDMSRKAYNIVVSKYLDMQDLNMQALEIYIKRNESKTKVLTQVVSSDYFVTKGKKFHKIRCESLNRINKITEYLPIELMDLEEKMSSQIQEPEKSSIINSYQSTEDFIPFLFVYDRNYGIVGVQDNIVLYRNTEDDIQDLEIILSNDRSKIEEIKIYRYQKQKIEGINTNIYEMTISLKKQEDGMINAKFVTHKNGYMQMEAAVLEQKMKELGNGLTIEFFDCSSYDKIDENGNYQYGSMELNTKDFGKIQLEKDVTRNHYYFDFQNNEYRISQSRYAMYDMIVEYSQGIMRSLEKKLITNQKGNKVLNLKKTNERV